MRLMIFALCVVCVGCSHSQPHVLAATPAPGESPPLKFDEPVGGVSFSVAKTEWAPAVIGPGGAAMLTEALQNKNTLMVLSGAEFQEPVWQDRVFQMVKAASPDTRIVARNSAVLDEILLERGEIPYRQTLEVGGQDVLGRPFLLPKDHPLQTDWLTRKKLLKGAEAILLIDFVNPDDRKLREMRAQVRGGCESLAAELKRGVAHSESWFSAFVAQVNDALSSEFTRQMKTALPFWHDELVQGIAAVSDTQGQDARCYGAYQKFLKQYDDCMDGDCKKAPMLHVTGGGVIGMELSGAAVIPHDCPVGMGRNYEAELVSIGERVSREVMNDIPQSWAGEFSKLNMLAQLEGELENLCAPAHRRYAEKDLAAARESVDKFIEQVVTARFQGKWEIAEGAERVPGVGAVRIFGRASTTGGESQVWMSTLQNLFKPLNRCRDSRRRPVEAVLVDVGTSEVYFSTIVFEEQLFCEDLPPN
ncbi:MAG: hypothetical protein JXX14_06920 [Deltaproteobacteria bacterium]|nr:hypothetical protein [Deltaproteobacteria bacterium]